MGILQYKAILITFAKDKPNTLFKLQEYLKSNFTVTEYSDVIGLGINSCGTICVAPCGSKLGWPEELAYAKRLTDLIKFLTEDRLAYTWVKVSYGENGSNVFDESDSYMDEE